MSLVDGRKYFTLFLTIFSLILGSESNRALLFYSNSNSEYGEILVYSDSISDYYFFKNVSNDPANRNFTFPNTVMYKSTFQVKYFLESNKDQIYPHTYGLSIVNKVDTITSYINYNSNLPEKPDLLEISTSSEKQWSYLYLIIIGLLLIYLVFSLVMWNVQTVKPLMIHKER